jgi:hypothetical protein
MQRAGAAGEREWTGQGDAQPPCGWRMRHSADYPHPARLGGVPCGSGPGADNPGCGMSFPPSVAQETRKLQKEKGCQLPAPEPPKLNEFSEINALPQVTKTVVEAARESLVVGQGVSRLAVRRWLPLQYIVSYRERSCDHNYFTWNGAV